MSSVRLAISAAAALENEVTITRSLPNLPAACAICFSRYEVLPQPGGPKTRYSPAVEEGPGFDSSFIGSLSYQVAIWRKLISGQSPAKFVGAPAGSRALRRADLAQLRRQIARPGRQVRMRRVALD